MSARLRETCSSVGLRDGDCEAGCGVGGSVEELVGKFCTADVVGGEVGGVALVGSQEEDFGVDGEGFGWEFGLDGTCM